MKFGQLIEYNEKIFFFKNRAKNETRGLVPGLFLFFKTILYEVKASGLQWSVVSMYLDSPQLGIQ